MTPSPKESKGGSAPTVQTNVPLIPTRQAQREPPTFLEKERDLLAQAKGELIVAQQKVARIQSNVSWLELNPQAEDVFKQLIEREIAARDKAALDKLVPGAAGYTITTAGPISGRS